MDQKLSYTVAEDARKTLQSVHHVPEEARPMRYNHRDTLTCPWDLQRGVLHAQDVEGSLRGIFTGESC